jgi:hypothetical protein
VSAERTGEDRADLEILLQLTFGEIGRKVKDERK